MASTKTFYEMIDLALEFPEIGSVNFNLLRSLLRALVKQLRLENAVTEFEMPSEVCEDISKEKSSKTKQKQSKNASDSKRDKNKSDDESNEEGDEKVRGDTLKTSESKKERKGSKAGRRAESNKDGERPESDRNGERLDNLEKKVSDMSGKLNVIEAVSSIEELISRSKDPSATPFSDLWNMTNLSKRTEACEESSKTLSSGIEELAKDTAKNEKNISNIVKSLEGEGITVQMEPPPEGSASASASEVSKGVRIKEKQPQSAAALERPQRPDDGSGTRRDEAQTTSIQGIDNKLLDLIDTMKMELDATKDDVIDLTNQLKNIAIRSDNGPVEGLTEMLSEISDIKCKMEKLIPTNQERDICPDTERIAQLEVQMRNHTMMMTEMSTNVGNQINTLEGQIADLEKEMAVYLERLNTGGTTVNAGGEMTDMSSIAELYSKLQGLQAEMENLNQSAAILMESQEDRTKGYEGLLEEIEIIKLIKADKESLEDALAEKADAISVNRKVSHDQFDAAYNELHLSIVNALTRLSQQEKGWLMAISEIQKDIGTKLDKIEVSPLQQLIEAKVNHIQKHLETLEIKRKKEEAAGTKKKWLKNVNCISCDKKVIMKTELDDPALPLKEPLPPNRSMRPYLTYELDHIRREHKRLPTRNIFHLENAILEKKLKDEGITSVVGGTHLCNRYCGGSHTMITNEQRVCHVGHFSEPSLLAGRVGQCSPDGNAMQSNSRESNSPKAKQSKTNQIPKLAERPTPLVPSECSDDVNRSATP